MAKLMRWAAVAAVLRSTMWRLNGLRRDRQKARRRATVLYAAGIVAGGFGTYWFLRRSGAFAEQEPAWSRKKQRKEARRAEAARREREDERRPGGPVHVERNASQDLAVPFDEAAKRR